MKKINNKTERIETIVDDFVFSFSHKYLDRLLPQKTVKEMESYLRKEFYETATLVNKIALEYEKLD